MLKCRCVLSCRKRQIARETLYSEYRFLIFKDNASRFIHFIGEEGPNAQIIPWYFNFGVSAAWRPERPLFPVKDRPDHLNLSSWQPWGFVSSRVSTKCTRATTPRKAETTYLRRFSIVLRRFLVSTMDHTAAAGKTMLMDHPYHSLIPDVSRQMTTFSSARFFSVREFFAFSFCEMFLPCAWVFFYYFF